MPSQPPNYRPLKLRAEGAEDIAVMSAALQDAIGQIGELVWIPAENRFAAMVSRYLWEDEIKPQRVRCALLIETVQRAFWRNLPERKKDYPVELLSLHSKAGQDGPLISLSFAGGGEIRLAAEVIDARLEDVGAPWNVEIQPKHEI